MKIYWGTDSFTPIPRGIATIGTFDGVHSGHLKVIELLKSKAEEKSGESIVITFWPHPRLILHSESKQISLLNTIDERIQLLEATGIDHLLILEFTSDFSQLSYQDFFREYLVSRIGINTLVVGHDHRFGKDRGGSMDELIQLAPQYGIELMEVPAHTIDEIEISSTKIRSALLDCRVDRAAHYLSYPYTISGKVVKGQQLGRTIGVPTANISVSEPYKLIPGKGVYAVWVISREKLHYGMMNIGNRPTVNATGITLEINILDFNEDIYDESLRLFFSDYIRPEAKFASLEELKSQLQSDRQAVKSIFNGATQQKNEEIIRSKFSFKTVLHHSDQFPRV